MNKLFKTDRLNRKHRMAMANFERAMRGDSLRRIKKWFNEVNRVAEMALKQTNPELYGRYFGPRVYNRHNGGCPSLE